MSGPVLVTGAGGFAGSHLVEHLSSTEELVGWGRSAPPAAISGLAKWQQVDLRDRDRVRDAIRDLRPKAIYHCAGLPHVAQSWHNTAEPLAGNALATHHLLEAVRRSGIAARVLITGTSYVYAPADTPITEDGALAPANPYALSKLAQEQLGMCAARYDGLDVIVARAFNHTGPRQQPSFVAPAIARQVALIERGALPPVLKTGNLDAIRDLTDVRDMTRAYSALVAAAPPGSIYNVASGVGRPIRAVVDALVSRATVPISVELDPARLRPNDVPVLVGDATRLRQLTGWEPRIPFEQTLNDLLDYWRAQN